MAVTQETDPRGPMLKTEGKASGILWFEKEMRATDAARIMSTASKVPLLAHEEVLAIGRSCNAPSHIDGALGIVKALGRIQSTRAAQQSNRSRLETSRALLRVAYSILSDPDAHGELKSMLARVDSLVECSDAAVLARLCCACGDLWPLFRLLWESHKVVREELSPVAVHRFRWPSSSAILGQLRDGRDRVICLPFFQVVREWMEVGDDCSECGVVFELEGVSVLPVFRRTTRGFALIRGAGVLAPLTPLQIRGVTPAGSKGARVGVSGVVARGYVLGGLGGGLRGAGTVSSLRAQIIGGDGNC
jgi:hypothetical protein